ncbi:MAG: hypothetical protein ACU0CT_15300 [Paracoccaceae bacterium]
MKILVPCAGRSSRYPNMPPKWLLPDQEGVPMVVRAVEKLKSDPADLVFTYLAEHEQKFSVRAGLVRAFGPQVNTVLLDAPTRSQSETVAETLRRLNIDGPFLVKDSDNTFELDEIAWTTSYITVASLNDFEQINPRNKSYVTIDQDDFVTSIREKQVISEHFSIGGYFFRSAASFLKAFDELSRAASVSVSELYISEIVSYLLLNGEPFKMRRAQGYMDWGTIHEWRKKLESRRLFILSVDGFLFQRGSHYFDPPFSATATNPVAIDAARQLHATGHKLIYLSIRPYSLESETRAAIAAAGLPEGPLMMEADVTQWTLVTAPSPSLPFRTCRAIEVVPDDEHMIEKLIDLN